MEWLTSPLSETDIDAWRVLIDDWFFVFAFGFLALELIRYAFVKRLSWRLIGDAVTNYVTLTFYIIISIFLLATAYVVIYTWASDYALFDIPLNPATIIICIILADLCYYWEHRFSHRVNMAWATHSTHHSSNYFNISVAYRMGPMDGVWTIFFHLPLVFLGFNPFVVFFAEMFVQVYQTLLHTESVKKLPKPVEAVFNTPSHHRVHHGANPEYLDKNYGGIFILWDRLFGTFEAEKAPVKYGLVEPLNTINPIAAFFHGFWRLGKKIKATDKASDKFRYLIAPPDWIPKGSEKKAKPS